MTSARSPIDNTPFTQIGLIQKVYSQISYFQETLDEQCWKML